MISVSRITALVDKPPRRPHWAFEVKWDGYRLAVHIEPDRVRIITRGSYHWTDRFTAIAGDARNLPLRPSFSTERRSYWMSRGVLTWECSNVRSDVNQFRMNPAKSSFAFDLLYLDGRDLSKALSPSIGRSLIDPGAAETG